MGIIEKLGFTPGPWGVKKIKGYCIDEIIGSNDELACQLDVPMAAKHNNSSLIGAAPEMFEALIDVINDRYGGFCPDHLLAVIEKASGKTWQETKELTT